MDLHFVRDYPAPPEVVWLALTEPDLVARWYMQVHDFEPIVGRTFRLHDPNARGWSGELDCTLTVWNPTNEFAYDSLECQDQLATSVRWTLAAIPSGTRITLDHTGFTGARGRLTGLLLRFGWKGLLNKQLATLVNELSKR